MVDIQQRYNKMLCDCYPFLKIEGSDSYEYIWLDFMPEGWRKAFGVKMCAEIEKLCLEQSIYPVIFDIKEKYGSLRFYSTSGPVGLDKIVEKYERLSVHTCIDCGKPAEWLTMGWIEPVCEECRVKRGINESKVIANEG